MSNELNEYKRVTANGLKLLVAWAQTLNEKLEKSTTADLGKEKASLFSEINVKAKDFIEKYDNQDKSMPKQWADFSVTKIADMATSDANNLLDLVKKVDRMDN